MMLPRKTLNEVIDFCYDNQLPYMSSQIQLFESYYQSNPSTAFEEWKKVYVAFTDPKLKYELNKHKVNNDKI
jgi:hypothetical protein